MRGRCVSKAFTKETEAEELEPDEGPALPAGVKNYITPEGMARLRSELKELRTVERPKIVDPAQQTNRDQVFFGARVTYADEEDRERTVRIVGIDETRPEEGEISWVSPVARALLKAELGDVVTLRAPGGDVELEILEISYER